MPLTPCHECEKEVSDRALSCPHCGVPRLDQIEQVSLVKLFAPWVLAFVVVFLLLEILF